ncbi:MAG: putative metal-dependent HD superfamily phosphohydrolase [Saprospiraceae bacterium]|jgi:predicted metal-dependent HD superfamily phosphohydrolase
MEKQDKSAQPNLSIKAAETYIQNLLETKLPANIYFHQTNHTFAAKDAVQEIGKGEKLSEEELELLTIAALFHDTGFIEVYEGHEEKSQAIAVEYLKKQQYPQEDIETVTRLIAVTELKKAPADLLEKVICDADMAHIGQKKYKGKAENLRKEREHFFNKQYVDLEWQKNNLTFLQTHSFYTETAKKIFGKRKAKNVKKVRENIVTQQKKKAKQIKKFSIGDNKAAQVMFKTALRNHIDLTSIADQKSNIMLSINALLLTIGMPIFASYLSDKVYLLTPSIIFMLTCITTMIFATLSTRPIKMDGETNLDKIDFGKTNLFFFGNFYKIEQQAYQKAIKKVIANSETLDKTIINDLYFLGHALGDKFRYLRTCYNVFIIGIILSFISFAISYAIYVPEVTEIIQDGIGK